jgi:hypothetical protein
VAVVAKLAVPAPVAFRGLRVVGGAAATDVGGAGFSIGVTIPAVAAVARGSCGETDTVSRASERATDDRAPTVLVSVRTAVA